jgi:hypothetical protein
MKRAMAVVAAVLGTLSRAEETKVIQEADRTIYRKKTTVDFTDVQVEGELTRPEGSYVINRRQAGFDSRIKVRADFSPELQKSVDHL